MTDFTHMDEKGQVRMVDVTEKDISTRTAIAQGVVSMNVKTFEQIENQKIKKGNVLETARIAGIMAAKKTADLIPMCHPLAISHAKIDFFPDSTSNTIRIVSEIRLKGRTGVEMEALTAVSVAALTIYDMCKSLDKEMTISDIFLMKKTGGKSGVFEKKTME